MSNQPASILQRESGELTPPVAVVALGDMPPAAHALRELVMALPPDTELSVVVTGAANGDPAGQPAGLSATGCALPVRSLRDGDSPCPGTVQVVPSGARASYREGRFHLDREGGPARTAAETLMETLAGALGPRVVGVVLGLTGADGDRGLAAVNRAGGVTMAARTGPGGGEAGTGGARAWTWVDHLQPPDHLGRLLAGHGRNLAALARRNEKELCSAIRDHMATTCAVLQDATGHDFRELDREAFVRHMRRRMLVLQLDEPGEYLVRLRTDPGEAEALFRELLLGVTGSAGHPEAVMALAGALARSNADLRNVLASCHTATLILDAGGRIRRFTEPARELYRLAPEDLGRPLQEIAHNFRDMPPLPPPGALHGGGTPEAHQIQTTCGRWFVRRVHPCVQAGGGVDGMVVTFEEITAVKSAQEALRSSEETARRQLAEIEAVYGAAPAGLGVLDLDLRFVRVNDHLAEMGGLRPEACAGLGLREVLPHIAGRLQPLLAEVMEEGRPLEDLELEADPPGDCILLTSISPLLGRGGRVMGVNLVVMDITHQKAIKRELVQARRIAEAERSRIENLFMDVPACIAVHEGPDHVCIFANRHYMQVVGRNDVVGRPLREAVPELEEQGLLERYDRVFRHGEPLAELELPVTFRPPGMTQPREAWFNHVLRPWSGPDGQVKGVMSFASEVTEEVRYQLELQESERRFRALADASPVLIWMADENMQFSYFNRVWLEFTGRTLEEAVGGGISPDVHPGDRDRYTKTLKGSYAERGTLQIQYRLRRADGEYRWILDHGVPRTAPDGTFQGFIGACVDITDRRRAEEALRSSERRFRELADAMPQIVWIARPDGSTEYCNRRWYEFSGSESGRDGLEDWVALLHPEDRPQVLEAWQEAVSTGRLYEVQYRFKDRSSGEYRWFLARASPSRDSEGRLLRWYGTCTDIDEMVRVRNKLERQASQLEEMDRRKDEFLAILGHELRNPLAALANGIRLIDPASVKGEDAGWLRQMMGQQVRQLGRLLDDLLDMTRISRGKIQLRTETLRVEDVLQKSVTAARPLVEERGQELVVSIEPTPLEVMGDPQRLEQVFVNLLNNAAKFTPEGGHIRLDARSHEDSIRVAVADTGQGLSPEALERIFEPFAQVREGEVSGGGLGIGLTLVRQLVKLHGGSVEAVSAGPGCGSTFTVVLPRSEAGRAAQPAPAEAEEAQAKLPEELRILVVDDNKDAATSLARLLERKGFQVWTAVSGGAALEAAKSFHPEVVLLDIGLPDVSGYDVARTLRGMPHLEGLWMVAVTGYGHKEALKQIQAAGFDRTLVKPVAFDRLLEVIAQRAGG